MDRFYTLADKVKQYRYPRKSNLLFQVNPSDVHYVVFNDAGFYITCRRDIADGKCLAPVFDLDSYRKCVDFWKKIP